MFEATLPDLTRLVVETQSLLTHYAKLGRGKVDVYAAGSAVAVAAGVVTSWNDLDLYVAVESPRRFESLRGALVEGGWGAVLWDEEHARLRRGKVDLHLERVVHVPRKDEREEALLEFDIPKHRVALYADGTLLRLSHTPLFAHDFLLTGPQRLRRALEVYPESALLRRCTLLELADETPLLLVKRGSEVALLQDDVVLVQGELEPWMLGTG